MNKTEQKAYHYLQAKGAKKIIFNSHNTIDFITDIGLFEVKVAHSHTITITCNQRKVLNENKVSEIRFLVYENDEDLPLDLSTDELKQQFKFWYTSVNSLNFTTCKIKKDTTSELIKIKGELQAKRGQTVNQDDVVQELIRCWRERK